MALLAQPKRKEKYGFDPRNTNWASDDNKFGQRLMEKMGWEKGKGLGANEDGMVDNIKPSYKSDTRGLGCSPRDADSWIAHQDDFNDLLRVLNEDSPREPEKEKTVSSDKNLKEGSKRFYGRFARGRMHTLRSTEDLDCILGRRKTSEPSTPVTQSATNSDEEQMDTSLKTVTSSYSVQEYFSKKMKELKSRKSANVDAQEDLKDTLLPNHETLLAGNKCKDTKPVYGAVSFSYNDEEESPSTGCDELRGKGWYDIQDWGISDKKDKTKDGKKEKKGKIADTEEPIDIGNANFDKSSKRKKEKVNVETSSCTDQKFSASQIESVSKNKEGERDSTSILPILEESVGRKKKKSKRKEKNDADTSYEGDDNEKRNERKIEKLESENKKESDDDTKVDTPLNKHEDNLKKKRKRSKREEIEVDDTILHRVEKKTDNSVSLEDETFSCTDPEFSVSQMESVSKNKEGKKDPTGIFPILEESVGRKKGKSKRKERKIEKLETENKKEIDDDTKVYTPLNKHEDSLKKERKRRKRGEIEMDGTIQQSVDKKTDNSVSLEDETFSCIDPEFSASQMESVSKNKKGKRDPTGFFPILEETVGRKKEKSKRKEKKDADKSYEGTNNEKRKERKKEELESEDRKESDDDTKVDTPLHKCQNSLKKKRKRSKREEIEVDDTILQSVDEKTDNSVSLEDEGAQNKTKKKRKKVEDECVGGTSKLLDAENIGKMKKKRIEETEAKFAQESLEIKKKKKKKQNAASIDIDEKLTLKSIETKNSHVSSIEINEQDDLLETKVKKKKTRKLELADEKKLDSYLEEMDDSVNDKELPEKEKSICDDAAREKLKKKRREKKKRQIHKLKINESFPGSNLGELKGYMPMQY